MMLLTKWLVKEDMYILTIIDAKFNLKYFDESSFSSLKMRSRTMIGRWRSCNRIAIRRLVL